MAYNPSDLFRRLRSVSSDPAPASTLLAVFGHLPTPGPPQSCEVPGPVTRPATAGTTTLNGLAEAVEQLQQYHQYHQEV